MFFRIVVFVYLIFNPSFSIGQEYISEVIEYDILKNVTDIELSENKLFFTGFNGLQPVESFIDIISIPNTEIVQNQTFSGFKVDRDALSIVNSNSIFLSGTHEDRNHIEIYNLDKNLGFRNYIEIESHFEKIGNLGHVVFGDQISLINWNGNSPGQTKTHSSLYFIDTSFLDFQFFDFGLESQVFGFFNAYISIDNNLLIPSTLFGNDCIGKRSSLSKISMGGELIWHFDEPLCVDIRFIDPDVVELENGTIFLSYHLAERLAFPYERNPNILYILNKDGELIDSKVFFNEKNDFEHFWSMQKGKEDYFFMLGARDSLNPADVTHLYDSVLTKHDDKGNIIWKRHYTHPEYSDAPHKALKLFELENGQLMLISRMRRLGGNFHYWVKVLDSEGCSPLIECKEELWISSVEEEKLSQKIEWLYIKDAQTVETKNTSSESCTISYYDLAGRKILNSIYMNPNERNTSKIDVPGFFIIVAEFESGGIFSQLIF